MLTQAQKDAWIAKLRDPETRQVRGMLIAFDGGYCAHGVLRHLVSRDAYSNFILDPQMWSGPCHRINQMNDDEGKSFIEIADYIEANVPVQEG